MEKCEENTLKCDENVSKSMKTGEEKRIVREMRPEDVPSVALLEAECFSEPWSEQAFSDALKQPEALMMVAEDTQQVPVGYCGIYLSLDEGEIQIVAVQAGVSKTRDCRCYFRYCFYGSTEAWGRENLSGSATEQHSRTAAV